MNDQLVPLSVLSLDLDPPTTGWPAYFAARGVPILEDDIGRPAIVRSDARQLFVEVGRLRFGAVRWLPGMMQRLRRDGRLVRALAGRFRLGCLLGRRLRPPSMPSRVTAGRDVARW